MFKHYTGMEYDKNFKADEYLKKRYNPNQGDQDESDSYGLKDKVFETKKVEKAPVVAT